MNINLFKIYEFGQFPFFQNIQMSAMIKNIFLSFIFLILIEFLFATFEAQKFEGSSSKSEFELNEFIEKFCQQNILEKFFDELTKKNTVEKGMENFTMESIQIGLRHFLCQEIMEGMKMTENLCQIEGKENKGKIECWEMNFNKKLNGNQVEKGRNCCKIWQKNEQNIIDDFTFTVYLTKEFRILRKSFDISAQEFLKSMAELEGYKTTSAGGSDFFFSSDKRFLLKKVQQEELDFFIKFPAEKNKNAFNGAFFAYSNFMQNSANSLLPKFFMLFRINFPNEFNLFGGENSGKTFLLMDSLFSKEILENLKYKFDLKGAVMNRRATKNELKLHQKLPTLRDLNFCEYFIEICHFDRKSWKLNDGKNDHQEKGGIFPNGIKLKNSDYEKFLNVINADLSFLVAHNIMDYSLLLGIQILDNGHKSLSKNQKFPIMDGFEGKHHLILYPGIIDILQPYSRERAREHHFWQLDLVKHCNKLMINELSMPIEIFKEKNYPLNSITAPEKYKSRFMDYIKIILFHFVEE